MADQSEQDAGTELEAETDGAGTDEVGSDAEVEGFATINTTRSNIKSQTMVSPPGTGGVGGPGDAAVSGIAIKEQGIK